MLHACFFYDSTCFMCLFIQYLAFSGTNLLTRCHSASSCFSAVFVFQKSCTENILGIARDKLPVPYNHVTKAVPENDRKGASQVARPHPARPGLGPRQGGVWAHLGSPDSATSPIYSPILENHREMR